MSKRYVSPDQFSIDEEFDLVRSGWEFPINFNAAPSQAVPIIRVVESQPEPALSTWGFGEYDAASVPVEKLNLDAGVAGLFGRAQRCIVPALGFYEWQSQANGRTKPYYIHVEDQPTFGFAGLWEGSFCTIVTVPANAMMAEIDRVALRMPAILAREMRETWLYGSVATAALALTAYPSERMVAYGVSSRVDSLDNNDETLIEPLQTDVD